MSESNFPFPAIMRLYWGKAIINNRNIRILQAIVFAYSSTTVVVFHSKMARGTYRWLIQRWLELMQISLMVVGLIVEDTAIIERPKVGAVVSLLSSHISH
jgi:hypothetical protein